MTTTGTGLMEADHDWTASRSLTASVVTAGATAIATPELCQ